MRQTYTHKLASGIEVEFRRMMSYHQEWLSKGKANSNTKTKTNKSDKNIDDVVADVLESIGGNNISNMRHEQKLELVQKLLSTDMKELLMAIRFFSVDLHFAERQVEFQAYQSMVKEWEKANAIRENGGQIPEGMEQEDYERLMEMPEEKPEYVSEYPPHIFSFNYKFKHKDENGVVVEIEEPYDLPIHFHEFEFVPPCVQLTTFPQPNEDYKNHKIKLPISGKTVRWSMLDVSLENKFKGSVTPENIHINTPLKWRNPCEMITKASGEGEMAIQLELSKMELLDIEALRKDIHQKEGKAESVVKIEHPKTGELVPVDILQVVTFFIPSGVA